VASFRAAKIPGGGAFLNEIADDCVFEIFNLGPLNLHTNVFLLLGLESQLDENLL
jgi:hypothetical protein